MTKRKNTVHGPPAPASRGAPERPRAYQRVFEQGEKLVGFLFILYVLPTSEPYSRLGIAVSKRIGNAVVRNRIKRYLREMFRRHKAFLLSSCDLVCVARREAAGAPLALYTQQFLLCCSAASASGKDREWSHDLHVDIEDATARLSVLRVAPLPAELPFLSDVFGVRPAGYSVLWSSAWSREGALAPAPLSSSVTRWSRSSYPCR